MNAHHRTTTAIWVNYFGHADIAASVRSLHIDAPDVDMDAPDVDMVVVDNSDNATEAAALRAALPPSVTLAVAPRNLGFGQACNWAASLRPEAAFYFLVNPDVRVLPGCLSALVAAMNTHPKLGAVAPVQFLDPDQTWQLSPSWRPSAIGTWAADVALRAPSAWRRYTRAVHAESRRLLQAAHSAQQGPQHPPPPAPPQLLAQRALSGAVVLVRRAALADTGGLFDPRYFMYYEDSDLCLRLRRGGWAMGIAAQARALHLWTMGAHKAHLMAQAAPIYFDTHFPASPWLAKAHQLRTRVPVRDAPHGVWPRGQVRPIPQAWASGWMLEVSPLPLLLPSAIRQGQGGHADWPTLVDEAVHQAPLWARLSPLAAATPSGPSPHRDEASWWRLGR